MSILQQNYIDVKNNKANGFTFTGMNDALMGINISGPVNPPLGVSPLVFFMSSDLSNQGDPLFSDTSRGGLSEKPNQQNLEGDHLEEDNLKCRSLSPSVGEFCNLDSYSSEDSVLQFINRHISASEFLKRKKVIDSYFEFLSSHKSSSESDMELQLAIFMSFLKAGADIDKVCRFLLCGTQIATMECEHCGYQHSVPYNCKLRICPRCSRIRASELVKKYQPYLESLDPRRVRCITLTIKNVKCLKAGVSKIRRCYGKLLHRKYYREGVVDDKGRREGKIKGSLYKIESTIGRDSLFHVHLHAIIVGDYIPQATLSKDWADVTEDKKVTKDEKVAKFVDWVSKAVVEDSLTEFSLTEDSMTGGFVSEDSEKGNRVVWIEQKEVQATLKYCMKHLLKKINFDKFTPEKLVEYEMALTDVRLVQATGCFLGVLKDYKKKPFECPHCGWVLWRITDLSGKVVFSSLNSMIRDYDKIKSPSTPSLCFISDG